MTVLRKEQLYTENAIYEHIFQTIMYRAFCSTNLWKFAMTMIHFPIQKLSFPFQLNLIIEIHPASLLKFLVLRVLDPMDWYLPLNIKESRDFSSSYLCPWLQVIECTLNLINVTKNAVCNIRDSVCVNVTKFLISKSEPMAPVSNNSVCIWIIS